VIHDSFILPVVDWHRRLAIPRTLHSTGVFVSSQRHAGASVHPASMDDDVVRRMECKHRAGDGLDRGHCGVVGCSRSFSVPDRYYYVEYKHKF
jgi:hypothetical protein